MATRENDCFEIRLRNVSGVPVLQLGGVITKNALAAIKFNLDRLVSAGHYNVVINLERVQAPDWQWLGALSSVAQTIRGHYGSLDIVAAADRLSQASGIDQVTRLFRFCASEGQAISRIKGLLRQPDIASETNARVLEKPQ